jgi:MFS family permease
MEKSYVVRTRIFSFAVPACMDGMINCVQVGLPLLAIRFGASPWFLGMLGWSSQLVRFPLCLGSGALSDKVGRTRVLIPAAVLGAIGCGAIGFTQNRYQLLPFYILVVASMGAFYPSLQAFIGDHSPQGQLRKNLSAFNFGWTVGGSITGLIAGYLLSRWQPLPFAVGAALAFIVAGLVLSWKRVPVAEKHSENGVVPTDGGPGPFLFIARTGHFLGFFAYSVARLQFPKLGIQMGMSESMVGLLIGMMLVGQAMGIFVAGAGPWWRGKLWPQILSQSMALASGVMAFLVSSPLLFAAAFLMQGTALGIAYTGALYYGLQARTKMGRNTGIHESLVASGNFMGSFAGGAAAQFINLRAPYLVIAGCSLAAIIVSLAYYRRTLDLRL